MSELQRNMRVNIDKNVRLSLQCKANVWLPEIFAQFNYGITENELFLGKKIDGNINWT